MNARRKNDDALSRSWYRTERVIQDSGNWYFATREGTLEGPFECRTDAIEQMEVYVRLAVNDLLNRDLSLALQA